MKVDRALLTSWQWTHYVRIEKVDADSVKLSVREFDGTRLTRPKVQVYQRNQLLPLAQFQGQWSWAAIDDDYLSDFSLPYSGIDKISWYHLRRTEHGISELFKAWSHLSCLTNVTLHQVSETTLLHFTEGVCRISLKEPQYGLKNGTLVTRPLPRSIVDGISNLSIRDIIESDLFPDCAIAVEASGNDQSTQIRYDVEVIDIERIFGKKRSYYRLERE